MVVSVDRLTKGVQKRLPAPPAELRKIMPEWYNYQLKLNRDIELNFGNVVGIRNSLSRNIESISVNASVDSASIVGLASAAITPKITSVNSKVVLVSAKSVSINSKATSIRTRVATVSLKNTSVNTKVVAVSTKATSINTKTTSVRTRLIGVSLKTTSINSRVLTVSTKTGSVSVKVSAVKQRVCVMETTIKTQTGWATPGLSVNLTRTNQRVYVYGDVIVACSAPTAVDSDYFGDIFVELWRSRSGGSPTQVGGPYFLRELDIAKNAGEPSGTPKIAAFNVNFTESFGTTGSVGYYFKTSTPGTGVNQNYVFTTRFGNAFVEY